MIQNLISIPCIMIIPTTLIVGRIMGSVSKKWVAAGGIIIFIAGGFAPVFMKSFSMILVMRGIFGIGIGVCQVVSNALVAENFNGAEKDRVQGTLLASAMCGAAVMVFLSGIFSNVGWQLAFYVYLIAAIPLLFVLLFVPAKEPVKNFQGGGQGTKITGACWAWVGAMLVTYISAQTYPVFLSFLLEEKHLGTASGSALGLVFFAAGGIVTGILFGWISGILKKHTITIGFLTLALSNVLIAFSSSMAMCYAGSLLIGVANTIVASCVFIRAGTSVDAVSAGIAISLVSCAQNFGQFSSPFVINFLAANLSHGNVNFMAFLCAGAIAALLAILTFSAERG
jgi:MFS family permease